MQLNPLDIKDPDFESNNNLKLRVYNQIKEQFNYIINTNYDNNEY